MRRMYDSVAARAIPRDGSLVAGYVNGRYAWTRCEWGLFPKANCVLITVDAEQTRAIVLDVENGAARIDQVPNWVRAAGPASGWVPTLYGTEATLSACRLLIHRMNVPCDFWVAHWTGEDHIPPGYSGCQWAAPGHGSPGHYDISTMVAGWPRSLSSVK